ncbi:MAG TPA: amino acid ABC transporter substrate-binding protein [Candidatus Dormibacteraeota bacterium]|nr:amino acid ABC transporter substrate-binding protein [Candidatus Dormibacteraeota bacterium]
MALGRLRRFLALGGLAVVLLMACGGAAQGAQGTSNKPIVIGGTLGLTGAYAGPSAEYKAVYNYWAQQINASGGLLGRKVKLDIYNDESTPTTAQTLYNRLIDTDHVDLLLAPYTTAVGGAIVPIALSHHMVLFNGGFVGIKIFDSADGWMVGTYTYQEPDYTRGVFELIKTLPADQRPTKVAILTAQNPFTVVDHDGSGRQDGALNYAKQAGMQVVMDEQYPMTTTDFSGLVQRAKASGADLFLVLGLPNDSLEIARTVYQVGYKPKIYCTCGSQMTTLPAWDQLGAAGNGVMGTTISWPNQGYQGLASLSAFFQKRGYHDIPAYGVVAYAILQVLQQAVEGAKTLDQAKLRAYILSHTFHTAAGNIRYQSNGTPRYSEIILQYQNGRNQVVWPAAYATAKPEIPLP